LDLPLCTYQRPRHGKTQTKSNSHQRLIMSHQTRSTNRVFQKPSLEAHMHVDNAHELL